MNLKEAASRLGLHDQAAYRHVRSGRLVAVKLANGYEISEDALARFVADDRAWQRTVRPDGRLRRRHTDDPDRVAEDLAAVLPGPGADPRPGLVLVARTLAAALGDSVVITIDGLDPVHDHADPAHFLLLAGPAAELHARVGGHVIALARRDGVQRVPLLQQRDVPRLAGRGARDVLDVIGVHSMVVAPIPRSGPGAPSMIGTILCSRDRAGRPYTADDERGVQRYAALAALALNGAVTANEDLPRAS